MKLLERLMYKLVDISFNQMWIGLIICVVLSLIVGYVPNE